MASFNRVILLGNCTRDVEVKFLQSGTAVANVGMAVSERRKDDNGQWVEDTTFVEVTAWGRTAEVAGEYLRKGSPVMIEGRLKLDQWEDKASGQKRSKLGVTCEKLQLIPTGSQGQRQAARGKTDDEYSQVPANERQKPATVPPADDIPF